MYIYNKDLINVTLDNNNEMASCFINNISFSENKLENFKFDSCEIADNIWSNTYLTNGSFIEGFIKNTDWRFGCFNNIKFSNIDLDKIDCGYAVFRNCEFTNISFTNCSFENAEFIDCKFNDNIIIENAVFSNTLFTNCEIPEETRSKLGE